MLQQLLNPARVTEVFAHLNETPDNRAVYSALVNGNDVTAQSKGVSLAPGYPPPARRMTSRANTFRFPFLFSPSVAL